MLRREKTIPSILGLVLLSVTAIGGAAYVIPRTQSLQSNANQSCAPEGVLVANITPTTADLSFTTPGSCSISILVGERIFQDPRKVSNPEQNTQTHYYQINNLTASTDYNIRFLSGGESLEFTKNFKTLSGSPAKSDGSNMAWGRVITKDQKPLAGGVVRLSIQGASVASSFITQQGNWAIPKNLVYNQAGTGLYSAASEPAEETIVVIDPTGKSHTFTTTSDNNMPVPDIIIDDPSYTIPKFTAQKSQSSAAPTSAVGSLGQVQPVDPINQNLTIKYPSANETIGNQTPEFFGQAAPTKDIAIAITGKQIVNATIQSDALGQWRWSPSNSFSYGDYTLTVSYVDSSQTSSANFTVSSDVSLAFVSTPSGQTPTQAILPTPTTIITPTITPTITQGPQPTIARTTSTPTPTVVIPTEVPLEPTAKPTGLPVTGTSTHMVGLIGAGFLLSLFGLFLHR